MGRVSELVLLLAAACAAACRTPPGPPAAPDLLVVTLDTTRADHIGAYGYAEARTPTIDALAARGVRFALAFASNPTTLPSHASLFTGLDPPSHGARANSLRLDAAPVTLAERLSAAGYRTAAFVGAFPLDSRFGLDQGFELYDDAVTPRRRGEAPVAAERDASAVTAAALAWLERVAPERSPLFLWVHYFDPHAPYRPPPPATGYDGEIAFADTELGRLLQALDEARGLERTLVVLTADHGESLGEHGEQTHGVFVYDATLHVPLVIAHPTLVGPPRTIDDRVVGLVDVVPTVLELLGLEAAPDLDGRHLLDNGGEEDRALYFDTIEPLVRYGWAPLRGLRTRDAKLIEAPEPEYYDLRQDRAERVNLHTEARGAAAALAEKLHARLGTLDPEELLPHAGEVDREVVERLASLGYVGTRGPAPAAERRDPKRMLPSWNRMDEALALGDAGRLGEAVALIDEILAVDPGNGRAWFLRGMMLQAMDRMSEAESSVGESVRLLPEADSYSRLAEILYLQERFDDGDLALARARAIDPQSGTVHLAEGVGAAMRGQHEAALRAFDRARAVDPANAATRADDLAALVEKMRDAP